MVSDLKSPMTEEKEYDLYFIPLFEEEEEVIHYESLFKIIILFLILTKKQQMLEWNSLSEENVPWNVRSKEMK